MMKYDTDYKRFNMKYRMILLFTHFIGGLFSWKMKLQCFEFISKRCFTGNKKYIHRSNDSFEGVAQIFDYEYVKDYIEVQLEGNSYLAHKRYKEFLIRSYGEDYLTPPPLSERRAWHTLQIQKMMDKDSK